MRFGIHPWEMSRLRPAELTAIEEAISAADAALAAAAGGPL